MKRLLCIISSLDIGGAETFLMKLYRKLPPNYKLDFVVSTQTGYYENEVISLGGSIYRVPMRTSHPIQEFFQLQKIVHDHNYKNVIKLCNTPIGIFDLLATKLGGANQIIVRTCNAGSDENKIRTLMNALLRPMFNKLCTVKIAPSRLAAEYTFGSEACRSVHYLHNGVDLNIYSYSHSGRDKIRKQFGISKGAIVIGHIGRFTKQKNHEFIIEVFEKIANLNGNYVLLLVGEGEEREKIYRLVREKKLDNKVIFAGIRSDIPDILSSMDVFILPSLYEGMPNTAIEHKRSD